MTGPLQVTRILVGVDFEEPSASAVAAAGVLAEMFEATLTAVHAQTLEMPAYFTSAQMEGLEAERDEGHARVAGDLQAFAARPTRGLRVATARPPTLTVGFLFPSRRLPLRCFLLR
jgi:hypothetical protein